MYQNLDLTKKTEKTESKTEDYVTLNTNDELETTKHHYASTPVNKSTKNTEEQKQTKKEEGSKETHEYENVPNSLTSSKKENKK
jgi:hypothetical protein